jgi:hypothetical protein
LAEKTIVVDCHIDVLNTFQSVVLSGLSKKTMVKRQHGDRLVSQAVGSYPRSLTLSRKVNEISEGMNPTKYQTSKETVESTIAGLAGVSFYLIYKTLNEITDETIANPVSVFLCASIPLILGTGSGVVTTWTAASLTAGINYIFLKADGSFSIKGDSTSPVFSSDEYDAVVINKVSGSTTVEIYGYVSDGTGTLSEKTTLHSQTSAVLSLAYAYHALDFVTYSISRIYSSSITFINSGVSGDINVVSIDSIDRTDSRLVKIIKLPYSPCEITYSSSVYHFPSEWNWIAGLLRLNVSAFSASFSNNGLTAKVVTGFSVSFVFSSKDLALSCVKGWLTDSKLLHSDFHLEKFTYDSFSAAYPLEKSIAAEGNSPSFSFVFHQTNTINSNMLFKITASGLASFLEQDFGNYIVSSRNNEETVFTNAYLNYLRNGYNYDKKSKALSATARWTGTAASVAGGVLATAVGAATGNPIAAATGVTMIASGVAQLTSAVTSQISDENTMQSKLSSLQAQATTVAGADDIDLLSDYGSNKLLYFRYDCSSVTKGLLEDLFYYYGYSFNKQSVPATNTREWFNFVQCSPDYQSASAVILGVYADELSAKLNDGITIYHAVTYNSVLNWDLDQEKENWEKWLVD